MKTIPWTILFDARCGIGVAANFARIPNLASRIAMLCIVLAMHCFAEAPPRTDYCDMLGRDIHKKMHSFIAGNHMYYIGGKVNTEWEHQYSETIGLQHPLWRDGRARGYGIAEGAGGTGHDKWGWEFWNDVAGPTGTVIIGGTRYAKPEPKQMIWRPDRVTCTYAVAGVDITETKFITLNDVLCSTVTASAPIQIEYSGRSYYRDAEVPTWDGDEANQQWMQDIDTSARHDAGANAVHIVEKAAMMTKLDWRTPVVKGRMMHDGMSILISASKPFAAAPTFKIHGRGAQAYTFALDYPANTPVTLSYAQHDSYEAAAASTREILADSAKALQAKTDWMNDLLNEQIPYFRCSDERTVKTYYYLWSLYFMYFTYTGEGYESYPHTQTAINNFMGLHVWDSWAYTAMGGWVVDKQKWAYGNILSWKHMVPFKDKQNALPDNFGTTWYSPKVWMPMVGAVRPAWEMYQKSGDKAYLKTLYEELFKPLYWDNNGPQRSFGTELNAIRDLQKMAKALGHDADVAHWEGFRKRHLEPFESMWSAYAPNYMAAKNEPWMDIWQLTTLLCDDMPDEHAAKMSKDWIMNSEQGYLAPVSLQIRPPQHPPNGVFRVSTISSWLAIEGMFRRGLNRDAVLLTQNHINAMNKDLGFPVAPECWDPEDEPWGSLYYNWDGPITDLLLKRIAGISYSVPDRTLTVNENMPEDWDYLEVRLPITYEGELTWAQVHVGRKKGGLLAGPRKTVAVKNSPIQVIVTPSNHGRKATGGDRASSNGGSASSTIRLGKRIAPLPTYAAVRPNQREFYKPITVKLYNLQPTSTLRCTLDGKTPTMTSPIAPETYTISESTTLTLRNFEADGTAHEPMTVQFTKVDLKEPAAPAAPKDGLKVSGYDGKWSKIPDFDELTAAKTATRPAFSADSLTGAKTHYGLRYDGFFEAPKDGLYTFRVRSDDGSRLTIAGQQVTEINILCDWDPWTTDGSIALKKGYHPLRLDYFQANNRTRLEVKYRVNNEGDFKTLGAGELVHE
jgi:hypothetical protein